MYNMVFYDGKGCGTIDNQTKFGWSLAVTALVLVALLIADAVLQKKDRGRLEKNTLLKKLKDIPFLTEGLLTVLAWIVFTLCAPSRFMSYNNYSYLADAWLHGRLDSPELPKYLESIQLNGTTYVHFAPGAAFLCVPFVALFGVQGFNAAYLCRALGALNVGLCYRMLSNARIGSRYSRLWMTALLGFGTVHFWCASYETSWLLGHVSTLFYLLLAFCLLFREEGGPWSDLLSGLFFGMAVCCRLSALLGGLFFAGYLLMMRKNKLRALLCFAAGAALFGSFYMIYNYVRFGTIMDSSYSLTYLKDYHREIYNLLQAAPPDKQHQLLKEYSARFGGPLQTKFISGNVYSIFAMLPEFSSKSPYVIPTISGVAVTIVSPALFIALLCPWKKRMAQLLWVTTVITAIPFLMNYGNGCAQFGMRYSMDFTPYLFLLACMGLEKLRGWKKGLIAYSIFANAWGALYWKFLY